MAEIFFIKAYWHMWLRLKLMYRTQELTKMIFYSQYSHFTMKVYKSMVQYTELQSQNMDRTPIQYCTRYYTRIWNFMNEYFYQVSWSGREPQVPMDL